MTRNLHNANPGMLLATALLVGLFVVAVRAPLAYTDLWGHLAYGRYFSEEGRFPSAEPFLPLSQETPFITTSWLAQWLGFQIHRGAGPLGLQIAYAALCTAIAGSILTLTVRRTREPAVGIAAMVLLVVLEYQQLLVIRPQLAGMLCFCLLLKALHQPVLSRWWIGAVMIGWANLHGSFVIGPVVIGLKGAGELWDLFRLKGAETSRGPRFVVRETGTLLAITCAAGLVNPYGVELYREVLSFSASANLQNLIEWKPLRSTPKQGTAFVVVGALGLLVIACTRLSFRWRDWLPAFALAAMTLSVSRYLVWFGPLYAVALGPHLKVLLDSIASRRESVRKLVEFSHRPTPWGGRIMLAILLLGIGGSCVHRPLPYGSRTPVAATERLLELSPRSLVLNTMEWGDWIIWQSRASIPVFVNSHVTFIPPDVWQDYMTLIKLKPDWQAALDKYPFRAAILQRGRHRRLIDELQRHPSWTEVYRDEVAAILLRTPER
jgi:hypothetical protein